MANNLILLDRYICVEIHYCYITNILYYKEPLFLSVLLAELPSVPVVATYVIYVHCTLIRSLDYSKVLAKVYLKRE